MLFIPIKRCSISGKGFQKNLGRSEIEGFS